MGARLSASEWTEGGFSIDEAVVVARALKEAGVAYVCASSGGNLAKVQVPFSPLYQVPFAERIRREAGIVTRAVGLITEPEEAEAIVGEGRADIVALARADPRRSALAMAGGRGARARVHDAAAIRARRADDDEVGGAGGEEARKRRLTALRFDLEIPLWCAGKTAAAEACCRHGRFSNALLHDPGVLQGHCRQGPYRPPARP